MRLLFALAILVSVLGPDAAKSQSTILGLDRMQQSDRELFFAYRQSENFGRILNAQANQIRSLAFPHCQVRQVVLQPPIAIYRPVQFTIKPNFPSNGVWHERPRFFGCERTPPLNILLVVENSATGASTIRAVALLPGLSLADPVLQRDTLAMLIPMAQSRVNCRTIYFTNTSVVQVFQAQKSWVEHWAASACGRTLRYEVAFTPSIGRPGTTFTFREIR